MVAVERITPDDAMALASDVGPAPMQIGGILRLDTSGVTLDALRARIASRLGAIPRMGRRLARAPLGCGRPYWVDDPDFDIAHHVVSVRCPEPGDDDALLRVAAEIVTTRLPEERPPWSVTLVEGVGTDGSALVVTFNHVLADGIGGIAILANLVDGVPEPSTRPVVAAVPTTQDLFTDALRSRALVLMHLREAVGHVRDAFVALRASGTPRARSCSLNRPTGPSRVLVAVRADLGLVRRAAHTGGGTVNDAVLAVVTGALHRLLAARGEDVGRFVVSIPVSARKTASGTSLGNQVGAVPVDLPGAGSSADRVREVASVTRAAKRAPRAASSAILGPVFRVLARLGLLHRFIDHQRLVHTFVTNVRGPDRPVTLLGARVTDVSAVAVVSGNVTVSFAVLSYAGTLTIMVVADPDARPDLGLLRHALESELASVISSGSPDGDRVVPGS